MKDLLFALLEIIGTIAFAVSGAMVGTKKNMDIFGVSILGMTTAVGGGILRDLILGSTPPAAFRDPTAIFIAVLVSIVIFLAPVRGFLLRIHKTYDRLLFWSDTLGLAIFTDIGISAAYSMSDEYSWFLYLFVGILTGVGGGVIRDIMAGTSPFIFTKHFYACASGLGALLGILLRPLLGRTTASLVCIGTVIVLRALAAHYRWELPKAKSILPPDER